MVKIVEEKDQQENNSPYASTSSSRTSSSVSLSSVGSELDGEESFYERLTALVDIVPPTTRHKISTRFSKTASFFKTTGKVVGNIVWIVTTSALLVGLPLALSLEDEAKIVAQEKEMLAQQQGAQHVCPHFISCAGSDANTALADGVHVRPSRRPAEGCRASRLLIPPAFASSRPCLLPRLYCIITLTSQDFFHLSDATSSRDVNVSPARGVPPARNVRGSHIEMLAHRPIAGPSFS